MYRLVVTTRGGLVRSHYYIEYDDLEYNAEFCPFSPNIVKAVGQELRFFKWVTLFTIEE